MSPDASSRQRTIAGSASLDGTGLHSGRPVRTTLRPAPSDTGILFRRTDLSDRPGIRASVENVTGVEWATVLGSGDRSVRTVEHLLAALAAAGLDNVEVQLEGPEPPALDGSAAPWCDLLGRVGVETQDRPPRTLEIREPLRVTEGDSSYVVVPHPRYRVSAEIDFDHATIGRQFVSTEVEQGAFCRDVAPARTFGLDRWREPLRERGLALGASYENTIVLTDDGLSEGCELRFPDEFVRHKIIDVIGDLVLVGVRIRGHVIADRPSHRGNVALGRRLAREFEKEESPRSTLGIEEILKYIPHRYPFLLVDRILEFEEGRRIVGLKNVTINEPFFRGHFPDHPIMPGVLIVEAMAQVGGLLLLNEFEDCENKVVYFMSLDDVKFRHPVRPGDQLVFELEMLQVRGSVCRMRGVGRVEETLVAEASMMARVADR